MEHGKETTFSKVIRSDWSENISKKPIYHPLIYTHMRNITFLIAFTHAPNGVRDGQPSLELKECNVQRSNRPLRCGKRPENKNNSAPITNWAAANANAR